jgi:DNA-binding transcriptional regulator LsrR (DeoR family)
MGNQPDFKIDKFINFVQALIERNARSLYPVSDDEVLEILGYKKRGLKNLISGSVTTAPHLQTILGAQRLYERLHGHSISLEQILGLGERTSRIIHHCANGLKYFVGEQDIWLNEAADSNYEQEIKRGIQYFQALIEGNKEKRHKLRKNKFIVMEMLKALRVGAVGLQAVPCWEADSPQKKAKAFQDFCQRYELNANNVHVVDAKRSKSIVEGVLACELVAFTAAHRVMPVSENANIGLGGGVTILRFIENIPLYKALSTANFVSLMAETSLTEAAVTQHPSNSLAATAMNRFPSSHYTRVPNNARDISDQSAIVSYWSDLDVAFMGVTAFGYADDEFIEYGEERPHLFMEMNRYYKELKTKTLSTAEALFLHQPINMSGESIPSPYQDKLHGINFTVLKNHAENRKIYLLAGGAAKKDAVLAALNTGCVSGLVVDDSIMNHLLDTYKRYSPQGI